MHFISWSPQPILCHSERWLSSHFSGSTMAIHFNCLWLLSVNDLQHFCPISWGRDTLLLFCQVFHFFPDLCRDHPLLLYSLFFISDLICGLEFCSRFSFLETNLFLTFFNHVLFHLVSPDVSQKDHATLLPTLLSLEWTFYLLYYGEADLGGAAVSKCLPWQHFPFLCLQHRGPGHYRMFLSCMTKSQK